MIYILEDHIDDNIDKYASTETELKKLVLTCFEEEEVEFLEVNYITNIIKTRFRFESNKENKENDNDWSFRDFTFYQLTKV